MLFNDVLSGVYSHFFGGGGGRRTFKWPFHQLPHVLKGLET